MAMIPTMIDQDRKRAGWSLRQAAWRLGVSVREYREEDSARARRAELARRAST